MRKRDTWIVGILLLTAVSAAAGEADKRSPKPCVAILAAEVVGEISSDERKALAGQLDMLLTESLTRQKGFATVDRQALDKVLAERKALAGGLTKVDPKDVAASLKPFFASGVLICPTIRKDKQGKIIVRVEAVLAQTGQLLSELHEQGDWKNGRWAESPKISQNFDGFWADIRRNLKRNTSLPLVEISGKLTSKITRLQWMVDDLGDAASARVALAPNAIPLVPRHPLNTREERLLRVMGLSVARAGDAAAGLCPTPDVRLVMELSETTKTGVSFAKTPISLKLSLQRAKSPAITTEIKSEAGKWEACRKKALAWIDTHVRALSNGSPTTTKADEEARAKKMAREELAAVEQWTGECAQYQIDMDTSIRLLIVRKALRAAHLDPTNEKAAYLVAIHVDVLYEGTGKNNRPLACYDRTIAECRRYLDRMPGNKKRRKEIREVMAFAGFLACHKVTHSRMLRGGLFLPSKPMPQCYRYVRVYIPVWMDRNVRDANLGNIWASSWQLRQYLIMTCPDDRIDQEHAYWREYWKKHVETIPGGGAPPWDIIDAFFHVRKKDWRSVRAAYSRLAPRYAVNNVIWRFNGTPIIPATLKAAGDPQWKTWKPGNATSPEINISLSKMDSFLYRLRPRTPKAWDLTGTPVIPVTEYVIPQGVRKTGRRPGWSIGDVGGLLTVGGNVLLVTPADALGTGREWNNLFVATVGSARNRKISLNPVKMDWPNHTLPGKPILTCSYATKENDKPTIWLGTKSHGLARFDKTDGKWTGRWYTTRNGMPTNGVTRISTCQSRGKQVILLIDRNSSRRFKAKPRNYGGPQTMIWTLNPNTNDVKLLFDGSKGNLCIVGRPDGVLPNGKRVLLELLGEGVYGDLDIGNIKKFNQSDYYWSHICVTRKDGKSITARIWHHGLNIMTELSLDTLKPMRGASLGRGSRRLSVFPVSVSMGRGVFGTIGWRSVAGYATMPDRWPSNKVVLAVGRADVLWIAFTNGVYQRRGRYIVGYRPAPKGSKRWSREDCWIGPFQTPANSNITHLVPDGENGLLLSTSTGVYRVDCAEAVAQAERSGRVCSTVEWRKQYEKRLAKTGWQSLVPKLILDKRWDEALKLLDDRQKQLGTITKASPARSRDEWIRLLLWRAHVNAKKPGAIANAIDGYDKVAGSGFADHPAEVFARMNQILLLHKAGRWQEMLDLCEKVTAKFPQVKPRKKSSRLNWYINDAKKNLKKASREKMSKAKP